MPTSGIETVMTTSSFTVNDGVLFAFLLLAAVYVVFTGIFYYHWQAYSSDKNVTWLTFVAYGVTTVPLMLLMGIIALTV